MPSSPSGSASRASSPLSSASSDAGGKPQAEQTGETSQRSNRSPTSSTIGLPSEGDDDSELTEEEEEAEERKSIRDSLSGAEQSNEEEELPKAPNIAHRNRIVSSVNTPSSVSRPSHPSRSPSLTPSLTPPPESTQLNSADLPPLSPASSSRTGSKSMASSISDAVDEDVEAGKLLESRESIQVEHDEPGRDPEADVDPIEGIEGSQQPAEDEDAVEDDEDDGDVTMRAVEPGTVDIGLLEQIADGLEDVEQPDEEEPNGEDDEVEEEEEEEEEDMVAGSSGGAALAEPEGAATPPVFAPIRPHSSHAPPPPPAAMRSLLELELKFAALRDKLYLERMEEAAAEEEMLLNGTHPALRYIYETLLERRVRLHEVASRRHHAVVEELKRVREAEKAHVWTWWTEQRDQVHWEEFADTWSKRRRLAREKTEIETPRLPRPVPRAGGSRLVKPFDWCSGAMPAKLGAEEAANDLAIMENRHVIHPVRTSNPVIVGPTPGNAYVTGPSQPVPPASTSYWGAAGRATPSMNATLDRQTVTASTGPSQPRREGRTVPTTSDVFDTGPRKRERETEAPASVLGLWNGKADEPSSGLPNGHAAASAAKETGPAAPVSTAATITAAPSNPNTTTGMLGQKRELGWMGTGFPSLSTFMDRPAQPNDGQNPARRTEPPNYSGLFGLGPKATSVLSPPKPTGILGARSPFGGQNASATMAGTQAARP